MKDYSVKEKDHKVYKMLFTNNRRRMAGLKPHRKTDSRKRYYTRCEVSETIGAWLDFCNNAE